MQRGWCAVWKPRSVEQKYNLVWKVAFLEGRHLRVVYVVSEENLSAKPLEEILKNPRVEKHDISYHEALLLLGKHAPRKKRFAKKFFKETMDGGDMEEHF